MSETPQQRSRTMRAVRSQDTGAEMTVRRFLHAQGLRFRLHDKRLPGTPDIVFASRRIVIFVHGCFWHQHPGCPAAARPQSNTEYWSRKLDGNVARDARHLTALQNQGWTVLVIWECETCNAQKLANLARQVHSAAPWAA